MTDTRARQLFDSYFQQYREHYGDTLADRYTTASDRKRASYDALNHRLQERYNVYREGDQHYTVLSADTYRYTCAAIYPVAFEGTALKVYVFEVHTTKNTYAWYISSDRLSTGYIAPVPASRTLGHQDVRSATMTEEALDRVMVQDTL